MAIQNDGVWFLHIPIRRPSDFQSIRESASLRIAAARLRIRRAASLTAVTLMSKASLRKNGQGPLTFPDTTHQSTFPPSTPHFLRGNVILIPRTLPIAVFRRIRLFLHFWLPSFRTILKRDALLECSNIDYQAMLAQMKSVPFSEVFSSQATNLLLEMLDTYDKSNGKRKDIIVAAVELAEWLRKENTFCTEDLRIINHLQAIRRTRVLSLEESHQLIELVENGKCMEERVYVGAYLLLDQQDAAQLHFMRMTEEEKKQVLQYPIGLFMRSSGQTET